jgi:hypothetical protein
MLRNVGYWTMQCCARGSTQFVEDVRECVLSFVRPSSRKRSRLKLWPLTSHRRGMGWIPGQTMWDLWQTDWHWEEFFSEYFRIPLSASQHHAPSSYNLSNSKSRPKTRLKRIKTDGLNSLLIYLFIYLFKCSKWRWQYLGLYSVEWWTGEKRFEKGWKELVVV